MCERPQRGLQTMDRRKQDNRSVSRGGGGSYATEKRLIPETLTNHRTTKEQRSQIP